MADLEMPVKQAIGEDEVRRAYSTLQKYKSAKHDLIEKIRNNERWWLLRHWEMMDGKRKDDPKPASAWLFEMITNKHADYMDAFPEPNILPREESDKEEAKRLSSVVPVVLDQNGFRNVYSEEAWYKLKQGTGVYGVFWDASKLGGLGDISIQSIDLLTLFWEPGIKDIQDSRNLFSVKLEDNDILEQAYPELKGKLGGVDGLVDKYYYDEQVDTTNKSAVVDWYYKKKVDGRDTVQYCKFVGSTVLYATENDTEPESSEETQTAYNPDGTPMLDEVGNPITRVVQVVTGPSMAERGLYDHGKYPFVFDTLFPVADKPAGIGLIDVCKNPQASIDIYNNALEKNTQFVAMPRYLVRNDGGLNEDEFNDPSKTIIHVDGNLGQDSYAPVQIPSMVNSNYIAILENKIAEMKETSGNRDATTGGTQNGVTAASAIAALQETAGKTSRDQISTTYDAYKKVVDLVIELIRQFYNLPRQFRITGEHGQQEFAMYDNASLQPQPQGDVGGIDTGYRVPTFDISVQAERATAYTKLSQNELAMQFYNAGFFNPQNSSQALACLDMMDFGGKDQVVQKVQQNGDLYQQVLSLQQQIMAMAQALDKATGGRYNVANQTAAMVQNDTAQMAAQGTAEMPDVSQESSITANARERAANVSRPV